MKSREAFEAAESQWAAQLTGKSLVIEANADPELAAQALSILGDNYRMTQGRDRKARLLRKYRASFLVGVCTAAFKYDVGGMWPYLEQGFGKLAQGDQALLSEAFRAGLDAFGLSRFTFPRRNVDEILMHAGIPGQRMDEFIELLVRRDSLIDGLDGRQFCQWIGGMSRLKAFAVHDLDAPTYRFLSEGREIAEDLVDRCLSLIDAWGGNGLSSDDVTDFPDIMHEDLIRAFQELDEKRVSSRSRPRSRRLDLTPRITFESTRGVQVRLPALELVTDTRVDWIVSAEGSTSQRSIDPPWPGDPVQVAHVPMRRPAKNVTLSVNPGDQSWVLSLVDPDDPLLVFDRETGDLIPPKNSLPQGEVWIAVPDDEHRLLSDLVEVDGAFGSARVIESPLGWKDWMFAVVSLVGVSKFRRAGDLQWRYVSSTARPTIDPVGELPHVRSQDGSPVLSQLPRITVPAVVDATGSGTTVAWELTVSRVDTGEPVAKRVVQAGRDPIQVDFPEELTADLLGTFDFAIKGPLGRGLVRRATVVSELEVIPDHVFRSIRSSGDGLVPSGFTVSAANGLTVPERVELDAYTARAPLKVEKGEVFLALTCTSSEPDPLCRTPELRR